MHDLFKNPQTGIEEAFALSFYNKRGQDENPFALLVASCVLAASVVTGGALNESVGADKGIPPTHPQLTKFSKVSDK